MRKFVLPLALLATMASGSIALAATNHTVNGTLKAINAKACTVTVDKTVYHFAKGCDFSAFKVGEKVTVTGHVYKKIEIGTKLVAASAPAPKPTTTTTTTTKKS